MPIPANRLYLLGKASIEPISILLRASIHFRAVFVVSRSCRARKTVYHIYLSILASLSVMAASPLPTMPAVGSGPADWPKPEVE